jgi:hypothetical protein
MAGVLACGPNAVLSHRSAAVLWGLRRGDAVRTEVTVPRSLGGRGGHPRPPGGSGPRRHHRDRRHPNHHGCSNVAGSRGNPGPPPARACHRASGSAPSLRRRTLAALVARHPGRRGTAVLKRILGAEARAAGMTRSELEDRFLRFLADRGLPVPRTNVWLQLGEEWIEVDCAWPDRRIVVELDSWAYHGTKAAFRRDRARDGASGWRDGSRHGSRHGTSTRGRRPWRPSC